MGCDYYSQMYFEVRGSDDSVTNVDDPTESRTQGYYFGFDRDVETSWEYLQRVDALYTKILYDNGVWNCTEYGKTRILELLEEKSINISNVKQISKQRSSWERM